MPEFEIYRGLPARDDTDDPILRLSDPPPWRAFDGGPVHEVARDAPVGRRPQHRTRALSYRPDPEAVRMVNIALHLRRPLLVTGEPGTGKSELAYAVAQELRLGSVLRWSITSRTVLRDGLYQYDAIGRVEEAGIADRHGRTGTGRTRGEPLGAPRYQNLGRYVRLGPLGTAIAPFALPRVLLIDEIDKSDIDLSNDLLDVFEEGEYEIPELLRVADTTSMVRVRPHDAGAPVTVVEGRVRCHAFPFVVMTSNGDREFPPAFLRRCVRLKLSRPDRERITTIVEAHLDAPTAAAAADLVEEFLDCRDQGQLATDQLLNAVYLRYQAGAGDTELPWDAVVRAVFQQLNTSGSQL
ncbi:MAG: AAA domain-containing protein [Dactylosporangium sp.]|nr:MoxR family ATPase [Dactylosporangium sp.]NNJ62710.1 AAA domain-containing protein [Dactylosporangium sp.]